MATRTLSFQKRARNPFSTPAWESSYTSSTGTDLLGAEYYAISYQFSPYNGSDVQSVTNIVFKAVLGGDWAQSCTYNLYLYSQDPAGYSSQPTTNLLTSTSGTKGSDKNVIQWTISGSYASYSTLYVLIMVDYGSGQVTLNHGSSSFVETYTAKALPQIAFGTISTDASGMKIPIVNGSNYTLTCVITAGNNTTPGNNAELYRGTSSSGQFDVPINAVQWFNAAGITNSLSVPLTIKVTGNSPNALNGSGTYQENRQASIDSMKPVVSSISTQIQQAAGAASQLYPNTYIAGYSKCKVTAVITRPTNAAISSVKLSYPGGTTITMEEVSGSPGTYTGTTSAALAQDTTFTVTAADVRGLSGSGTKTVTGVVAYVLPSVSVDLAYRCDEQGVETNGGDHYRIKVTAKINANLPNNAITELTVGLKGAPAAERHDITNGTTSSAFGTLSDPKKAYVITVIIQDKISGQIVREYTLKGKQRDLVLNHDGGHTHLGVGMTPIGKDFSGYKDTIELPNDGLFLVGGIPVQAYNYPHIAGKTSDNPCFGRDFHNVSADRMGEANASAIFGFPASQYDSWSNLPDDPYDQQTTPTGIRTLGWAGWREVYWVNQDVVLVKITEIAPKTGRIWFCSMSKDSTTHEYTWSRWRYLMPTIV